MNQATTQDTCSETPRLEELVSEISKLRKKLDKLAECPKCKRLEAKILELKRELTRDQWANPIGGYKK